MLRTLALAALRDWPFSDDSVAGIAAAAAPRIDGYAPGWRGKASATAARRVRVLRNEGMGRARVALRPSTRGVRLG
ncbi:MAG: hypothetical protein M0P72_07610 [Metallibacterium scheffleri]|jgi:hypothetical protein|uniref:hypothetical protein n=1 Tax=Metallibacterium scheffleri TaxID=993689 RepID=UPI0026EF6CF5|nr:hypothetical protein [Metallibacterium scheffleri]MCK9366997.1 hypothetical protein [Metallibacterium scheffleri]